MPQQNEDITPDGVVDTTTVAPVVTTDTADTAVTTDTTAAQPVVEADETSPVSMDDFDIVKDILNKPEVPVVTKTEDKADTTKVEDKKAENKTVQPAAKTEDKTAGSPVVGKKGVVSRDYAGIPQDVVPLFQRMSNEAFDKFKPFYLEAIATKQKYDELVKQPAKPVVNSFYDHPEAFTLSDDYRQASATANEAQLVLEHWREQLDAVRNGATEFRTLARDPQSKQIVYGATQKVDQRTQSSLEQLFFNANTQATKFATALGEVKNSYVTKHQTALADLKAYEDEHFKFFEGKPELKAVIDDSLSKLNPAFRGNPFATPFVKAMLTIRLLTEHINKLSSGQKTPVVEDKTKKAQAKAGPTASGVVADVTSSKDEVTFDDFNKVKEID